jgi:excinuclease ABC subunit A
MMKKRVSRFLLSTPCAACQGKRLKPEALSVTFNGLDIAELSHLPLAAVAEVLRPAAEGRLPAQAPAGGATLDRATARRDTERRVAAGGSAHAAAPDVRRTPNLSDEKRLAARRIAQDVLARIEALTELGLGYLSIDRSTPSLSAGELQRLRLATQMRSHLFGVVYVLDEPSAGLHPADGEALLRALQRLKQSGNSVFVVEHDLGLMSAADWLVDVGPDAGSQGGRIVYSGPPAGLRGVGESRTAPYLFDRQADRQAPHQADHQADHQTDHQADHQTDPQADDPPAASELARSGQPIGWLKVEGVHRNNLAGVDVAFPLGALTCVTGVSGSGKSSLVSQALVELVAMALGHEPPATEDDASGDDPTLARTRGHVAEGLDRVRRLVQVDQKPIGRTPRSNLATYTGLFDPVRKLFAATPDARRRRYDAGRFSFNVAKGRCDTCEGEGFVSVELLFMPSVYAPCPTCHGARYNEQTLAIRWRDRHIAQVLDMTVDEAAAFFDDQPALCRPLQLLQHIGLGYLRLGQPATELSGGEAQRIKLATELQRAQRGQTLYVLDEPTTGLHPLDTDRLMAQLRRLVTAGNTVVIVEHDMRVVAASDWVIDIGPGAGADGGRVVAAGPPSAVAGCAASRTARYLSACLRSQARA